MAFFPTKPSQAFIDANPHIYGTKKEEAPIGAVTKWQNGDEKKLNGLVCAELSRRGIPYIVARTDQKSTIRKGWPDITAMMRGRVCCVELKASGGTLSKDQRECLIDLENAGIAACVCYNFDTAIAFILQNLDL